MFNLDNITNKNNKKHKEKLPYIPDHPYITFIIGGSESEKTNALLNFIKGQENIDKIYLYAKDLSEPRHEFLIKKSADPGKQHLNDSNAFIDFSNTVDEVFENVDNYNPCRKKKILVLLDEMIADIMTNKKRQAIIKEKFNRCRKFNTLLVFIMQSYFFVPKDVRQS